MIVEPALPVIRKNFDDPTVLDLAMNAAFNHPFEFGFECREAANAPVNLHEMLAGEHIGFDTGLARMILQHEQSANGIDIETKFSRVTDERKSLDVPAIVQAPVAFTPVRGRQKPDLLIISDRGHFDATGPGGLSDR